MGKTMDKEKGELLKTKHKRKYMLIENKFVLRPISYSMDIPNKLVKHFDVDVKVKGEDGAMKAIDFPTFENFCTKNKINKQCFYRWIKQYPEMKEAHEFAKMKQKEALIVNGLANQYNSGFAKFVGMNELDMVEKKEITNNNPDITDDQKKKMIAEFILDMKLKEATIVEGEIVKEN